jgi:hypothetical protein
MSATISQRAASPTADEHEVVAAMRAEGLAAYRWDNDAYDT